MIFAVVVRLLLAYFVVRALGRLIAGIGQGMRSPGKPAAPAAVPLARDPVCGTFVVPARAVSIGEGPRTRFFCSDACRRAYEMNPAP